MALLVLLAAAAVARIVAARLGGLAQGFHTRAHALPQLAQVVHGPDGFAEGFHARLAGAGWAVFVVHADFGLARVVFGQGNDAVERIVQPLGGFLVAGGGPVFGPVFHSEHEAQGPHLAEGWDFLAFHFSALGLRQAGHGAAHVHRFGLEGALVVQRLHVGVELGDDLVPAAVPQLQKARLLGSIGKGGQQRQRLAFGHFQLGTIAQQHGQVFGGGDGAAAADHGRHEAIAELPLRNFFATRAQVVQQVVEFFQFGSRQAQRRGGSRGSGGQFSIALGRSGFGGIHGWAPIGRRGRRGALGLAGAPAVVAQRRGREFIRQHTPRPAHGRDSGTIAPLPTGALRTFSKSLYPRFQARTVVQPCPALS